MHTHAVHELGSRHARNISAFGVSPERIEPDNLHSYSKRTSEHVPGQQKQAERAGCDGQGPEVPETGLAPTQNRLLPFVQRAATPATAAEVDVSGLGSY